MTGAWPIKGRLVIGIFGLLILGAFGVWISLNSSSDPGPGILEASGRIEGDQAAVGAKIGGRIVHLPIHEGQALAAGQLIAELSSEQARAQLERAEHDLHMAREQLETARARLLQAEADRERAEQDYLRYQELLADGAIAAQVVDQAKAAFRAARAAQEAARRHIEAAKARIQSAEAGQALAQANVKDTRVMAPFSGTVLRKLVEGGEVVAAGTPLVTFVDLSKLHVKVYLPERDIGKVKLGSPAQVYVDAFPKRFFDATVSEVSQQAEFTPRDIHMKDERVKLVFAVKLALKNPEGFLKPGMPADARIRWKAEASRGDDLE
ncbi:MAG: HlyD family secretion protein [Candidatus Methylomirabilales bacterium]